MEEDGSILDLSAGKLAELADQFWETYQKRLAADKVAAGLKEAEVALSEMIIHQLLKQKMTSIGGRLVKLSIGSEPDFVPTIKDYTEFAKYVLETKDLSLLERRVSKSAVKERWELDQEVPGIVKFPVYKLSKSQVK